MPNLVKIAPVNSSVHHCQSPSSRLPIHSRTR